MGSLLMGGYGDGPSGYLAEKQCIFPRSFFCAFIVIGRSMVGMDGPNENPPFFYDLFFFFFPPP